VSGWLKALVGTAIAIPLGIVAFVWWLESAFTGSRCKDFNLDKGTLVGDIDYQTMRLSCSGRPDEFTVVIGPGNWQRAAVAVLGGPKPELKRLEGRVAWFAVGPVEVRVELDNDGRPKARADLKDGKVVETVAYPD